MDEKCAICGKPIAGRFTVTTPGMVAHQDCWKKASEKVRDRVVKKGLKKP